MARLDPERLAAWRALSRAHVVVQRELETALADRNLPLPWFEILLCLQEARGRRRAHELAEELHIPKSSLTRQLDRLEQEGYIRRDKGTDDDGRSVIVVLTRQFTPCASFCCDDQHSICSATTPYSCCSGIFQRSNGIDIGW